MRWIQMTVAVVSVMVFAPVTRGGVVGSSVGAADECGASALPSEIQVALARDFSDWRIQQASNLTDMAHGRWAGDKQTACAGLAVGRFTGMDTTDYALLLVPAHAGDPGYELVVYKRATQQAGYAKTVVEKSGHAKARNYFIRSVPASEWIDGVMIKSPRVQSADGIEVIDCGEDEYQTDVYFWSNGKFTHEAIDN